MSEERESEPTIRAQNVVNIGHQTVDGGFRLGMGSGGESPIPVHKPPRSLPPRQETFAGRESELADLHALLGRAAEIGITQQAAVHGHGGVGKTSLAVEYAWRHLDDFPGGVFFLPCESALGGPPLHTLAPHIGIAIGEHEEETTARVRAHLETGAPCLLILDDVKVPGQWTDREWQNELPAGSCRRLITTRAGQLPGVRQMYPLQRLTAEDGLLLLAEYRADVAEAREVGLAVVEWFDGLAIGLTVAGVYMQMHPGLTWEKYARSLSERVWARSGRRRPSSACCRTTRLALTRCSTTCWTRFPRPSGAGSSMRRSCRRTTFTSHG